MPELKLILLTCYNGRFRPETKRLIVSHFRQCIIPLKSQQVKMKEKEKINF